MRDIFEWDLVETTVGVQLGEDSSTLDATKQMFYLWQYVLLATDAVVQMQEVSTKCEYHRWAWVLTTTILAQQSVGSSTLWMTSSTLKHVSVP